MLFRLLLFVSVGLKDQADQGQGKHRLLFVRAHMSGVMSGRDPWRKASGSSTPELHNTLHFRRQGLGIAVKSGNDAANDRCQEH